MYNMCLWTNRIKFSSGVQWAPCISSCLRRCLVFLTLIAQTKNATAVPCQHNYYHLIVLLFNFARQQGPNNFSQCTMGLSPFKNCIRDICPFAPIFQGNNCFNWPLCKISTFTVTPFMLHFYKYLTEIFFSESLANFSPVSNRFMRFYSNLSKIWAWTICNLGNS